MSEKESAYHHGDLRAEIARIAWAKVQASGVDALSLRACAREADVDPAAVYRHFKSKEALLRDLADRAFAELAQALHVAEELGGKQSQRDALVEIGLAYIRFAVARPHIFQMMFELAGSLSRKGGDGPPPQWLASYQTLVRVVERLNPEANLDVQVFTLWSVVHGFAQLQIAGLGPDGSQREALGRAMCERMADSLT